MKSRSIDLNPQNLTGGELGARMYEQSGMVYETNYNNNGYYPQTN